MFFSQQLQHENATMRNTITDILYVCKESNSISSSQITPTVPSIESASLQVLALVKFLILLPIQIPGMITLSLQIHMQRH